MRDALNRLSWNSGAGQAIATQAVSENTINLGAANKQLALSGRVLGVHFFVVSTFTGMASGLRLEIVDDDNAALSSARIMASSRILTTTDLVAGAYFFIPVQAGKYQQYLGAQYSPESEAASGNIISWFGPEPEYICNT